MAEELKPCPFCGSPAELERDSDHHGEWFNLGCSRHWGRDPDAVNKCPGGRIWYTADPSEESQAITAWNTRSEGPLPVGGEGREDLGSVGSGLTPLVPSRVSDAGSATPSEGFEWERFDFDADVYVRATGVVIFRDKLDRMLRAMFDWGSYCEKRGSYTLATQDGLENMVDACVATALENLGLKASQTRLASDGEARQAKPAGDRTQGPTTPNLPPRAKP